MKITCVLFQLVFLTLTACAQQRAAYGHFKYQVTLRFQSQVIDSRVEELFYDGTQSIYVRFPKTKKASVDTLTVKGAEGSTTTIVNVDSEDNGDFTWYKNYTKNELISREKSLNRKIYIVEEPIPSLDWKLTGERKKIGSYDCQKATTTFRCADYTAWFTTAIPISIGPWKIGGLPGMIVQLTNERVDLTYLLLSAEYPLPNSSYTIVPPATGETTLSFAEFAKLQSKELDKRMIFLKSTSGNPSGSASFSSVPECYSGQ